MEEKPVSEKLCDERYGHIKDEIRGVRGELKKLNVKFDNHLRHIEDAIIAGLKKHYKVTLIVLALLIMFVLIPNEKKMDALNMILKLIPGLGD